MVARGVGGKWRVRKGSGEWMYGWRDCGVVLVVWVVRKEGRKEGGRARVVTTGSTRLGQPYSTHLFQAIQHTHADPHNRTHCLHTSQDAEPRDGQGKK